MIQFLCQQKKGYKIMINPSSQSCVDKGYTQLDASNIYCIAPIVGGGKLWQTSLQKILASKSLWQISVFVCLIYVTRHC